ncbi:DUF402 domain-containing protein [Laceyella tengchongensis]|uniref:DUF402 domain-containing protein n=1 Tax=Laceyella tengchongensis TaxID=574699 RepID=UPI0012B8EF9E|nr:DUF402 domain-containing protein [Laceyella tengchongensis]
MIKLQALKYPDILHYEWEGECLERTDDGMLVWCKPGRKLVHHTKNKVYVMDRPSLEYFSFTEWFTAAMQIENGQIASYYCNVAMPATVHGNVVRFVDLDLDLVKKAESDWQVVDEDEFRDNSVTYQYPEELIHQAVSSLDSLRLKIANGEFPFDETLLRKYVEVVSQSNGNE